MKLLCALQLSLHPIAPTRYPAPSLGPAEAAVEAARDDCDNGAQASVCCISSAMTCVSLPAQG